MEPMDAKKRGISIAVILILLFTAVTLINVVRARLGKTAEESKVEVVPVQTVPARTASLDRVIDQTGDLRSGAEVTVYPKVPGKIIEILKVDKGDFVNRGELLAALEARGIEAQIQQDDASLHAAQADLDLAEKEIVRLRKLFEMNAVSQQRLDVAEARQLSAKAQVEGIQAQLRQLKVLRDDHKIFAPISGYVSARYVDRGSLSDPGRPVLRISSDKTLKIVTTVTERDFPNIRKGMPIEMRVDAFPDKTFSGEISLINPTLDPATRTGEVEIHVENPDLTLRSGMFAHLEIHLGKKEGVVAPRDALKTDPGTGRFYLFVVKDGKAELRNLKLGRYQENDAEVLEGVSAGEQVVIKGQNRLKHGYAVTVETGEGGAAPKENNENKENGKGKG